MIAIAQRATPRASPGFEPKPEPSAVPPAAARIVRGWRAPAAAFAAGALAALGFEPVGIAACTLFGLAALVWLIEAAPAGKALRLGWWWGLGHFALGVHWIAEAFTYQAKMPASLGWVAVAGLSALLATMPALAALLARRLPATPAGRLWAFPAAWMLAEWLRGWLFTGFPWNPLAAASLPLPPLSGLAAVIGALGVSGLIALAAAATAHMSRGRSRDGIAALAVIGVALALGLVRGLQAAPPAPVPGAPLLLIVQPNIGQSEKWDPGADARHIGRLVALSDRPAPAGRARIIAWPEVALAGRELEQDPALRARLAALLRPGDMLLTGGLSIGYGADGRAQSARNALFVLDSTGRILGRYDKFHLVPGGEYVPLRPLADALGLSRLAPGSLDFTPGPGPRTLPLPDLPDVGPLVCYEMIFPAAIVDADMRPQWLLNVSNDAWFGGAGPPQHLALARLRAIEEGLPMARSTPDGVSALIGPGGRLLATVPQGAAGVIEAALPGPLPATPFARLGHLSSLALALALAGLAAARSRI